MKIPNKLKGIVLLYCVINLFLSGCSKKQDQPQGGFPTNVVGYQVESQNLSEKISLIGTLESNESIEIKNEVAGILSEINFIEGEFVSKGTILFQLHKEKLEAAYDQAKADLSLAEATANRYEVLVQSNAVSQQEYDQAKANLEVGRAALQLAREQLEDTTIKAPFQGTMGERLVSAGQFLQVGTLLSYLYNNDPIKAAFHVPERYLSKIQLKQKITLRVTAYPDTLFDGEVYFIDPKIDEKTRTILIKAFVANPDAKLRAGMFANLDLITVNREEAVLVPESALLIQGDSILVYLVDSEEKAVMQPITIGTRQNGMVEVTSGVQAGDRVVIEGHQKIGPGSLLMVRLEKAAERKSYEII